MDRCYACGAVNEIVRVGVHGVRDVFFEPPQHFLL